MNVQAIAIIIKDSALQFLADKHSLTVDEVVIAVQSGNVREREAYFTRIELLQGVRAANELRTAYRLSVTPAPSHGRESLG